MYYMAVFAGVVNVYVEKSVDSKKPASSMLAFLYVRLILINSYFCNREISATFKNWLRSVLSNVKR